MTTTTTIRTQFEAMSLETLEAHVAHNNQNAAIENMMSLSPLAAERYMERAAIAETILHERMEKARKLVEGI